MFNVLVPTPILPDHESAPKVMRRNMPDPLPILLLGRLAIDRRYHNQGLGSALLRDAMTLMMTVETVRSILTEDLILV